MNVHTISSQFYNHIAMYKYPQREKVHNGLSHIFFLQNSMFYLWPSFRKSFLFLYKINIITLFQILTNIGHYEFLSLKRYTIKFVTILLLFVS